MSDQSDYQALMSDLVKKQMLMLGPNLVLLKARQVSALTVGDDGTIQAISGDPQKALSDLANKFMELSGQIAQMTLSALLEKYPNVKRPQ